MAVTGFSTMMGASGTPGVYTALDRLGITASKAGGTPPSLTPATPSGYNSAYGGIPQVPNPADTQAAALAGDQSNLAQIEQIIQSLDTSTSQGALSGLETTLPGFASLEGAGTSNALNELAGKLPSDVTSQIEQAAAERGIGMGMGVGSPNGNAAMLRALGLTSLDLTNMGQNNFASLVGLAPRGQQVNPASMLLDPTSMQDWQYLANELGAAPNPTAAAQTNLQSLLDAIGAGRNASGGNNPFGPIPATTGTATTPLGGGFSSAPAAGWYDPGQNPTLATGLTGDALTGGDQGASAYSQAYGETLPPGMGYDPTTDQVYQLPGYDNMAQDYASAPTDWGSDVTDFSYDPGY